MLTDPLDVPEPTEWFTMLCYPKHWETIVDPMYQRSEASARAPGPSLLLKRNSRIKRITGRADVFSLPRAGELLCTVFT